ncbi:Nn.00g102610.m01.CDS01 [Neocucurbitaria sp. VM-36]
MFGKTGLLFLAAATGLRVAQADFIVYTEPPIPTSAIPSFANPSEAASWTTSVFLNANFAYGRFTNSLGSTYKQSESSVASEIAAFVSTASNYSIPAAVTDSGTTTFFSQPDWYTALPSGARAFKEQQVSDQFSIVRSVIEAGATTATSTAGAAPTARAWVDAKFGVMAAAAAAAFL